MKRTLIALAAAFAAGVAVGWSDGSRRAEAWWAAKTKDLVDTSLAASGYFDAVSPEAIAELTVTEVIGRLNLVDFDAASAEADLIRGAALFASARILEGYSTAMEAR